MADQEKIERLLSEAIGHFRTGAGLLENRSDPRDALVAAKNAEAKLNAAIAERRG